jgi:hypothetical protein
MKWNVEAEENGQKRFAPFLHCLFIYVCETQKIIVIALVHVIEVEFLSIRLHIPLTSVFSANCNWKSGLIVNSHCGNFGIGVCSPYLRHELLLIIFGEPATFQRGHLYLLFLCVPVRFIIITTSTFALDGTTQRL